MGQAHKQGPEHPREMSNRPEDRTQTATMLWEGESKSNKWVRDRTREGWREKGKHVRRLNVTEGLLFAVLWGGNRASERHQNEGRRRGGGRQWEQCVGRGQNVRQPCSVRLQTGASLPNKQHYNQTNAAQQTASTLEIIQLWHKIKHSATRRSKLEYGTKPEPCSVESRHKISPCEFVF